MNYPIPDNPEAISALGKKSITEEIIAVAIAGVVKIARQQGQSLEDLQAEILQDDRILDIVQRRWLKDLIIKAWDIV
ncbi:conserved hypothetical protein [Hyella patelloides LEGE 07179]|uniref:Uncharacterized protein n=1 Tax=Hyella patelloides LEGE 07179 TaxID=945734 RepID=A0A563VJC6_9CYAN|nr:hypothetical protein [Hyella patelloides]VEP11560.1 conserved hypothetical protein [Hyella patelloides LEGE 07179]